METQNHRPLTSEDIDDLELMLGEDATLADKVAARELALDTTGAGPEKTTLTVLDESGQEIEVPVSHIGHRQKVGPRLGKDALQNALAVDSKDWHSPES